MSPFEEIYDDFSQWSKIDKEISICIKTLVNGEFGVTFCLKKEKNVL